MKRLLYVGDAACPSGFARATHEILDIFRDTYEITVLGMNYRGDPHPYPYPIYACAPGGDPFGVGRLIWMCDLVKPDLIILQNDPWNVQPYIERLSHFPEYRDIPVIAFLAVDGKNIRGEWLKGLTHAIFWTEFAAEEARLGGYTGTSGVVPLGVNTDLYRPLDKRETRARHMKSLADAFIVGNVNRNQPRKRWDLTLRYFAGWVNSKKITDAYLYLHTAPTGDKGVDVKQLARYYGIQHRVILVQPDVFYGLPEETMVDTYNCFDVQMSTTQGEGFGLTTFEGMACGVPQIVPDWSALGELCKDAAWLVPCTSTVSADPWVNIIGGVADEAQFIKALDALYRFPQYRENNSRAGLERVKQPRFNWVNVGRGFALEVEQALIRTENAVREREWQDLGRPEEVVAP